MKKPCLLQSPQDKLRARVAKNCLLVTLTSLIPGYGSLIESYQRQPGDAGLNPLALNSVSLTEEQAQDVSCDVSKAIPSGRSC